MKPLLLKVVGALLIALAIGSLMFRIFGGSEHAIAPWSVALVVIAIGVFLMNQARLLGRGAPKSQ